MPGSLFSETAFVTGDVKVRKLPQREALTALKNKVSAYIRVIVMTTLEV